MRPAWRLDSWAGRAGAGNGSSGFRLPRNAGKLLPGAGRLPGTNPARLHVVAVRERDLEVLAARTPRRQDAGMT